MPAPSPSCTFAAGTISVAGRVERLLTADRTSPRAAVLAGAVAVGLVALPLAALVVH